MDVDPLMAIYPESIELLDWLNHGALSPLTSDVFEHYQGCSKLVQMVNQAECGEIPKYSALSAIREYNEKNSTSIVYEDVKNLDDGYIMEKIGGWIAYMDDVDACKYIVTGEYSDPEIAFLSAPGSIEWIIVWIPCSREILIYRSPFIGHREAKVEGLTDSCWFTNGTKSGEDVSYVLPPEIEAAIGYSDPYEIIGSHKSETLNRVEGSSNARLRG